MRLLAFLIFLLTSFATVDVLRAVVPGTSALPLRLAIVVLMSFVAVVVHELGHALVAKWVGARVHRFVAVPISYDLDTRKWRWIWRVRGGEVGGYVTYTLNAIGARRKQIAISAAGPGASLVLALAAWGMAMAIEPGLARGVLDVLGLISFGLGIANLVPFDGSDGQAILRRIRATRR